MPDFLMARHFKKTKIVKIKPIDLHIAKSPAYPAFGHGLQSLWSYFDATRLYMTGKYGNLWKRERITEQKRLSREQRKLFGYKLSIEHIKEDNPHLQITPNRPTLYLHGWKDNKNSAKVLKKYFDVLPGDVVVFNFPDGNGLFSLLKKTNFGQMGDVLPAVYTLKWIKDVLHPDAVDIFGVSRGGAVAINMLAVLNDKTGSYDEDLATIGVDAAERIALLDLIQRGSVTLDCPLTNMNSVIQQKATRWFPESFLHHIASTWGCYQRDGLQGIESARHLIDLRLNVLIHFQHRDTIVMNFNEAEFYQRIAAHNPDTTYLVLGDDGGHIHWHGALSKAIHTFRKNCGASYNPMYDEKYQKLAQAQLIVPEGILLRPGQLASDCISEFHAVCGKLYA
jgi:pimeloyl-ACP methyl ester carboxylesterase